MFEIRAFSFLKLSERAIMFQILLPKVETPPSCPACGSDRIHTHHLARNAVGDVGTVTGATAGAAGALSGAEAGAAVGVTAGPAGVVVGALVGAVTGALIGASAGRAIGRKVGRVVDDHLFDNYECLDCGHTFGKLDH